MKTIPKVVNELCNSKSFNEVSFRRNYNVPMPSIVELNEIIEMLRAILFPGYFGISDLTTDNLSFYVGSILDAVSKKLRQQILRGHCFVCENPDKCDTCVHKSDDAIEKFLASLPRTRHLLSTDVVAAYEGDPAAKDPSETIFCYPGVRAIINHRIAHELYKLNVPLIPRIISESAHSETGIDIHPGAQIGERFFIDHGTGVVIGETCIIGNNVSLYQGVTLGAKNFPLDKDGKPVKGIPRHPIVEDDVIIYSGATILGRITLGKGSVIGGNVWLTESIPPGSKIVLGKNV